MSGQPVSRWELPALPAPAPDPAPSVYPDLDLGWEPDEDIGLEYDEEASAAAMRLAADQPDERDEDDL